MWLSFLDSLDKIREAVDCGRAGKERKETYRFSLIYVAISTGTPCSYDSPNVSEIWVTIGSPFKNEICKSEALDTKGVGAPDLSQPKFYLVSLDDG